jgi:hypothetical protein
MDLAMAKKGNLNHETRDIKYPKYLGIPLTNHSAAAAFSIARRIIDDLISGGVPLEEIESVRIGPCSVLDPNPPAISGIHHRIPVKSIGMINALAKCRWLIEHQELIPKYCAEDMRRSIFENEILLNEYRNQFGDELYKKLISSDRKTETTRKGALRKHELYWKPIENEVRRQWENFPGGNRKQFLYSEKVSSAIKKIAKANGVRDDDRLIEGLYKRLNVIIGPAKK